MCNFNSSHAEGRLNASLFYFIKIVMSSCSAFDERRLRWKFNRSESHKLKIQRETSEYWRVKKYLNIQKVSVNRQKWPRKHFRGKWIQFDRTEREFFTELSLFALQKSSGATLYKWAKFLSILNIILTSQQNEQLLLRTNKNQRQTVDNLTAWTLLNFAEEDFLRKIFQASQMSRD